MEKEAENFIEKYPTFEKYLKSFNLSKENEKGNKKMLKSRYRKLIRKHIMNINL